MANLPESPQWEDGIYQIEVSDPVLGGPDGISNRQAKQLAKRTSYLKQQVEEGAQDFSDHLSNQDPHSQYAKKDSPVFIGTPTAPTPAVGDNSKKLPTTEFVVRALAAAIGSDSDLMKEIGKKLAKDQNGADIPDPALFIKNLGLGEGSALPVGVPIPWSSSTPPTGWLKCNGAAFTAAQYPKLAQAYPTLVLPDLRGEFIRGWDDGRGVDVGRTLLFAQSSQNLSHSHDETAAYGGNPGGLISTDKSRFAKTYYVGLDTLFARPTNGWTGATSDLATALSGGNESRPRNIAFNYIVRAA